MGKQGKKRCLLHILALVHILFTGDLLHHFYFAVNTQNIRLNAGRTFDNASFYRLILDIR